MDTVLGLETVSFLCWGVCVGEIKNLFCEVVSLEEAELVQVVSPRGSLLGSQVGGGNRHTEGSQTVAFLGAHLPSPMSNMHLNEW